MKKLLQWPELLLPLLLWCGVIGLVVIRNFARIDELTVGGITMVYVAICYLCYALPVKFLGRPLPVEAAEASPTVRALDALAMECRARVWLQVFLGLTLILACAAYLYSRRDLMGMETFEARLERGSGDLADNRIMPIYAVLSALGVTGIYYALASGWSQFFQLAYIFGATVLGILVYLALGTRYEVLLPAIMLSFSGYVLFNGRRILRHRATFSLVGLFIVVGVLGLNSLLSLFGFRLGAQNTDANELIESGDRFTFKMLGKSEMATQLQLSIGLLDQYALQPVLFLDHYLKHNDVRPVYGAHQFSYVARRLGTAESGEVAKARVDQLYEFIGVPEKVNVWATLMREVAIDAGVAGGPVVFIAFGCLVGFAKRYFCYSHGAQFLVLYLTAVMLFSPFSSLFKSNFMQAGFYAALLWFFWDCLRLRKSHG